VFKIEPRLEKLITNYNKNVNSSSGDQQIILAKVDIDKFEELSSKYNVKAVPTGKFPKRFMNVGID
jgi:thioredoxin-like negative regulator of GroEL